MQYVADLHTHTIASGHAYSSIAEMVQAAQEKGLQMLGITEHAPAMEGTCDAIYFQNLKVVPRQYENLEVAFGVELNILDYQGNIDLEERHLKCLQYAIASIHGSIYTVGSRQENTHAYLCAMENPYVRIIGHPDDGRYPVDYEAIVRQAKATGVLLEVNNTSLAPNCFRQNARENYKKMLDWCQKLEVPVVLDSDAHITYDVGNTCYTLPFLKEIGFPEELVANTDLNKLKRMIWKS